MRQILVRQSIALIIGTVTSSIAFAQQPPATPPRPAPSRAAVPAPEQRRQVGLPADRQEMRGRGAPGGRGGQFGRGGGASGMLISMKGQLELTDDQIKKLEALRNAPRPKRNEAELLRARADMVEAMEGDGDLVKARAAMDKMSGLRNNEQIARIKERQDVRNVLTAVQKTRLDNMRGAMRGMRAERMRGSMRDGRKSRMQQPMRGAPDRRGPGMEGSMPDRMQMGPGMGRGQDFAPGGRRGRGVEQDVQIDTMSPMLPLDSLNSR